MAMTEAMQAAEADCTAARVALRAIINTTFLPFTEPELLSMAKTIEGVARLAFAAQVRIAGTIDQQKMAEASAFALPLPPHHRASGRLDDRIRRRRCPGVHPCTMGRSRTKNPDATPPTTSARCSTARRWPDRGWRLYRAVVSRVR
jgi:hypothetical protein